MRRSFAFHAACGWPHRQRLLRTCRLPVRKMLDFRFDLETRPSNRTVTGVPANLLVGQDLAGEMCRASRLPFRLSVCRQGDDFAQFPPAKLTESPHRTLERRPALLSSTTMTVSRLRPYATTVFAEMSALAARIGAVNLGQGFPDEDGPPALLKAAQDAIAEGANQYPPGIGIAPLRHAIVAHRRRHFGIDYDPGTEVLVTVGATAAIAAAVIGRAEPGSEVVLIEPFYDSYSPVVAMAVAHRVAVPLVPDGRGFALDADALRRAGTPPTPPLIGH